MTRPELSKTNIIILYDNIFRMIADMMNNTPPHQEGSYNIWLCQDLQTGWYHVRAEPSNVQPHKVHNPIKRLDGWSPNRGDPGSLYIRLLEEIKTMFQVENILPSGWKGESGLSPARRPDLPPGIA